MRTAGASLGTRKLTPGQSHPGGKQSRLHDPLESRGLPSPFLYIFLHLKNNM